MVVELPGDVLVLLCEELANRLDFRTLFNCALAGKKLAMPALSWLYRFALSPFGVSLNNLLTQTPAEFTINRAISVMNTIPNCRPRPPHLNVELFLIRHLYPNGLYYGSQLFVQASESPRIRIVCTFARSISETSRISSRTIISETPLLRRSSLIIWRGSSKARKRQRRTRLERVKLCVGV